MISEEHLLFMAVFLKRLVQFNLTGCASCNGHTEHAVRKKIEALQAAIGEEEIPLQIISDPLLLRYKDAEVDRREFFSVLRNATQRSAVQLIAGASESGKVISYGDKELPFKRHILNTILGVSGEELRKKILSIYYYSASCSGCNVCGACVGVCPTGALKMRGKDGISRLLFDTSKCCGCMICDEFCPQKVLSVSAGYSGLSPFTPDSLANSQQKDVEEIY
jgi:ferredoxin